MLLISLLHVTTGLVEYRSAFSRMWATDLINSASEPAEHQLAFWFTFTGLLMALTGYLMDWVIRKRAMWLPVAFGYVLSGICLVGIVLIPLSGFWLVLPLGLLLSFAPTHRLK